jgi:putative ABC transport system permease protein
MPPDQSGVGNKGDQEAGVIMAGSSWSVTLRGIRYRAGRSLVVFLLATVATAAAVLAPGYARAAQHSVLLDALRSVPAPVSGLRVTGLGVDPGTADGMAVSLRRVPALRAVLGAPIAGVTARVELPADPQRPVTELVYRSGLCAHLRVVSGGCPPSGDGVLVSARTAAARHLTVGGTIRLGLSTQNGGAPGPARDLRIAGVYQPRQPGEAYWWNDAFFQSGSTGGNDDRTRYDAVFTAAPSLVLGLAPPRGTANVPQLADTVDYPVLVDRIAPDDVAPVRHDLTTLTNSVADSGGQLTTALPSLFDEAAEQGRAIAVAVPVVAVPLVLLSWFVLYLMIASLTEERGPEIALAKLRGFRLPEATRFGLGEALVLIVLAGPAGLIVGLAVVQGAAWAALAPGAGAELTASVVGVAVLALAGAALAALLAARRTLTAPVMALIRRVPERSRWRATAVEGGAAALAAAALYQVSTDKSGTLALLAPPLLAFVLGLVAARLVGWWAAARLRVGHGALPLPVLLSLAQLARRPLAQRVVLAVTVAVSLLTFATVAWDAASHQRDERAAGTIGASTVYTVSASGPQQLRDAVDRIDPSGRQLAPVVSTTVKYGNGSITTLATDPRRMAAVATWPGRTPAQVSALTGELPEPSVAPLTVRGPIALDADVRTVRAAQPAQLMAVVAAPDSASQEVLLGPLVTGARRYSAPLPGCEAGCHLVALGVSRYPGDFAQLDADLTIRAVYDGGKKLDAGLDNDQLWRWTPGGNSQTTVQLSQSGGLGIQYSSEDPGDLAVDYADGPQRLPAVLAGGSPADNQNATDFEFPAFGGEPVALAAASRTDLVPRAGGHALLVNLSDVQRTLEAAGTSLAEATPSYEVWAGPAAPGDVAARLGAAGLAVRDTETLAGERTRLGRQAPGLALRLYLIAAVVALLLSVGLVLLTAYVGAEGRLYEVAALRVAGVRRAVLRLAVGREYGVLLGVPLLAGAAGGALGAALMLPALPLVTAGDASPHRQYQLGPVWVPGALLVTILGLAAVTAVVLRMLARAEPDRLRAGAR